jgi:hypothetical protein
VAAGCGGGGGSKAPTAAQLRAQEIQVGTFSSYAPGIDPDELDRSGLDLNDTVRLLGHNRYELIVQNFSNVGFINSFWFHAPSIRISAVTGSSSGTCVLQDPTTIACSGMKLRPPKCTCQSGGIVKIHFTAKSIASALTKSRATATQKAAYEGIDGGVAIHEMTPVPYHIPSYLNPQANLVDLPLCAKGQESTKAHLCVHGN